jgi:hypothetical protein
MLKLMEIVLLAVTLAIVLGLVVAGRPEAPPVEQNPVGAREAAEEGQQPKAS